MTLSRCTRCSRLVSHPQVHLKFLTRFLHTPSRGSICGPRGPAAGLSHAPSAQAAQTRCSRHNPSPAGSARQPTPRSSELLPLRLFACMLGSQAWKPSYGQTSVYPIASPREPRPRSANIWRTTRTCLTLHRRGCESHEMRNEGKSAVCAENMGFCYNLVIGKQWELFELCTYHAIM